MKLLHLLTIQQHEPGARNLWRTRCTCGWSALSGARIHAEAAKAAHLDEIASHIDWDALGPNSHKDFEQ